MINKQNGLMVLVALVAGLIGGVSSWWLRDSPAFAQKFSEPARIIQAERFEVVDKDGKLRAVLALVPDGGPYLRLTDKDRTGGIALDMVLAGGPGLRITDKHGIGRAMLFVDAKGVPSLALTDKDREVRTMLTQLPDGAPGLVLFGKDRNVIWQAL